MIVELGRYVIDELLKSENHRSREYGRAGHTTAGQPDDTRVEHARVFIREVGKKIMR